MALLTSPEHEGRSQRRNFTTGGGSKEDYKRRNHLKGLHHIFTCSSSSAHSSLIEVAYKLKMAHTEMEKYIECIINHFHEYSVRVEHWDMLSKGELKQMFEQQMPTYLKKHKDAVDRLMNELDKDKNKQLDFGEFMGVITRVLIFTHDNIHAKEHQDQHLKEQH
ncbi:UNVERIFIED_CONTAM: hypothetical protein K2H54_023127 [Gekko kuhli]